MGTLSSRNVTGRIALFGAVVGLFLLGIYPDAWAQPAERSPHLAPEEQAAAQQLQAQQVAQTLGLSEEVGGKLVAAYQKARGDLQKALDELRREREGDRSGYMQKYRERVEAEKGKLEAELKSFLSEEQAAKALASLGTFSQAWDRMVDMLAGFNLDEKKLSEVLALVDTYVIDTAKVRQEAAASSDWQNMRTKLGELKEKLDTALGSVLSEEQLKQWKEATTAQRRPRTR